MHAELKLDNTRKMVTNFDFDAFENWTRSNHRSFASVAHTLGYSSTFFSNCKTRGTMRISVYTSLLASYNLPAKSFLIPDKVDTPHDASNFKLYGVRASRGHVFTWRNPKSTSSDTKMCLVISSESRAASKMISILFLTEPKDSLYPDNVVLFVSNKSYTVSTDMITFTFRNTLVEDLGAISKSTMDSIDIKLRDSLGI